MENNILHNLFIKEIKEIDICGNKGFSLTCSDFTKPYEIIKLKYEEHNLITCEKCNSNYNQILKEFEEKHKRFPYCCEYHKNLLNAKWFNKNDFFETPKQFTDRLFYSWHHILNFIEKDNWEVEILDFLEHALSSFGSFPEGYGEPLYLSNFIYQLKLFINSLKELPERRNLIISYLDNYGKPKKENKKTDLNILIIIYNEWYKTFPFELSFFNHLKSQFSKNLPLFENHRTNKYTGLTTFTAISKAQLFNYLITITNKILIEINTDTLIDKGVVLDFSSTKLELIRQQRKQKIKSGYISTSTDEDTKYRKILKEWLKDEIKFIKEITPLITKTSLINDLLNSCYIMQENKVYFDADEDTRTKQVLDLLSNKYETKDQSKYGISSTGKKSGSVDGVITYNNIEYFIEAFNLIGLNRNYIEEHIKKLENKYDSKGLKEKFILIYYNIKDGKFENETNKYKAYLKTEHQFIYNRTKDIEEIESVYTNSKILKSYHNREGIEVFLYHILLKFPEKKPNL